MRSNGDTGDFSISRGAGREAQQRYDDRMSDMARMEKCLSDTLPE